MLCLQPCMPLSTTATNTSSCRPCKGHIRPSPANDQDKIQHFPSAENDEQPTAITSRQPPMCICFVDEAIVPRDVQTDKYEPDHSNKVDHNAPDEFPVNVALWQPNTLYYITLHYITLHYITLHYITLHYITLHYITLHYITLHYITLHYITLHYITLHYITLHIYRADY